MSRAIASCVIAMCAVLPSLQAATVNGIRAVVDQSVITMQDVQDMTSAAVPVLRRQFPGQDEVVMKKLVEAEKDNLDQLTERHLILHNFKTAGYNLPESVLDDLVQERIRSKYGDRSKLTKTLQEEGITFEKFRQHLREQFIVEAMRNKFISSEIIISPHKVESYYKAHQEEFKMEDRVKLRMIVLSKSGEPNGPDPKGVAREILTRLKDGVPFSEMAALYSQRAQRGTEGEWFEVSGLRKELADAVKNLKQGETSEPIETSDGYYLLHIEEVSPAHYKPLNEVRPGIESTLLLQERNRLSKQWVERMKKKTFVSYYMP